MIAGTTHTASHGLGQEGRGAPTAAPSSGGGGGGRGWPGAGLEARALWGDGQGFVYTHWVMMCLWDFYDHVTTMTIVRWHKKKQKKWICRGENRKVQSALHYISDAILRYLRSYAIFPVFIKTKK